MSANIDLDIFLKGVNFSLNSILEEEGFHIQIKEFQIFDDWEFTNEEDIDLGTIDLDGSDLFWKKFTSTYFVVNNTWRCVLLTSLEDECTMHLSFGLNSSDLLPDDGASDDILGPLYEKALHIIDEHVSRPPFQGHFFAANIGVESSVKFDNDITTMVHKYNGGAIWIVPVELGENIPLEGFIREGKKNIIVLTKSFKFSV